MTNYPVLLLNQNYEPLHVCPVRRAVVLIGKGKAEIIVNGMGEIRTTSAAFDLPSVIRLVYQVRRPLPMTRLTRREAFLRDNHRCQYCGATGRNLTLDHVVPRVRGGKHEWENVVTACMQCNHRKAGRTPQEAGMRLSNEPARPQTSPYRPFQQYLTTGPSGVSSCPSSRPVRPRRRQPGDNHLILAIRQAQDRPSTIEGPSRAKGVTRAQVTPERRHLPDKRSSPC